MRFAMSSGGWREGRGVCPVALPGSSSSVTHCHTLASGRGRRWRGRWAGGQSVGPAGHPWSSSGRGFDLPF